MHIFIWLNALQRPTVYIWPHLQLMAMTQACDILLAGEPRFNGACFRAPIQAFGVGGIIRRTRWQSVAVVFAVVALFVIFLPDTITTHGLHLEIVGFPGD
jgi:hypothetical protein